MIAASSVNPIIPGFSPDPSVVRVDGWYFLVNSTFHLFPGLPIYASQDLVSWQQIGETSVQLCLFQQAEYLILPLPGNAIHRQGQLSLAKSDTRINELPEAGEMMLVTGGLYAPTIRHHNGTFYVVCTNVVHPGDNVDVRENFVISTEDIWSGQWSDPVRFDFNGIDPSILFDDGGKIYMQGSASPGPYTKINQFEVNLETGEKLSEERTIWEGTGGIYPEGPHLYKQNGWYYLMISEGGTHEGHMITLARSRHVWGPYDPCPNNPILTARGTEEYIRYTGHCDAFQDDKSQWWGVCLGVRKDSGGRFVMGRETFLTPGSWKDDWLSFQRVKLNPEGVSPPATAKALSAVLNVDYLYIRDASLANYRVEKGSKVTLVATPIDLSSPEASPTFISKRQRQLSGQSNVTIPLVSKPWAAVKLRCGLAYYKDEHRYFRIYYNASEGEVAIEVVNNAKRIRRSDRRALSSNAEILRLRVEYSETEYRLLYSAGPGSDDGWGCLATLDTLDMTGPDFVGPVIGVFAVGETSSVEVEFRDLHIE